MFICIHVCAQMHVDAEVVWPHSSCWLTDLILCTYSLWPLKYCLDNYLKLSKMNNWLWSLEIGFLLLPPLYANLLSEPWTLTNAWLCLIFMYLLANNQPCEAVFLWWATLSQLPHLVHSTIQPHLLTCTCCWIHLGNSTVAPKHNSLACFLFPKNIPSLALLWPVTHISPMPTEVWNWIIPYLQHLHPFAHTLSLHLLPSHPIVHIFSLPPLPLHPIACTLSLHVFFFKLIVIFPPCVLFVQLSLSRQYDLYSHYYNNFGGSNIKKQK